MIPQTQQALIGDLLNIFCQRFEHFYPEITMNSLEEAYHHVYTNKLDDPE